MEKTEDVMIQMFLNWRVFTALSTQTVLFSEGFWHGSQGVQWSLSGAVMWFSGHDTHVQQHLSSCKHIALSHGEFIRKKMRIGNLNKKIKLRNWKNIPYIKKLETKIILRIRIEIWKKKDWKFSYIKKCQKTNCKIENKLKKEEE